MRTLYTLFFVFVFSLPLHSERIYIMNSFGYNTAQPDLIAAIVANGHTVDVNLVPAGTFPAGFTTSCANPATGYDWLCLFGEADYSPLLPQIKTFIDAGGKVFCQYEVSCCTSSSGGTAALLAGLTGLPIVTNVEDYIGLSTFGGAGWEASNVNGCMFITGNAYKGMDGIPAANQFVATGGTGTPAYTVCTNFGFKFTTTDFLGTANNGAITGLGDVNAWYNGAEPSAAPINTALVDFFFPSDCSDTCFVFAPGCMLETTVPGPGTGDISLGNDTTLCTGETLVLSAATGGATYEWQDGSTNATFTVTGPGLYWVEVNSPCTGIMTDSIEIDYLPGVSVDLGNDTTVCAGAVIELDASANGTSYEWQDGSTDSTFTVTSSGIYWVQVGTACGSFVTDSIEIAYLSNISLDLGDDITLCEGQTTLLNATTAGATAYAWQDGATASTYLVSAAGQYTVEITGACNTVSDSVEVFYIGPNMFDFGHNDTVLCLGHNLEIGEQPVPGVNYLWQDGSTGSTYFISQPGMYWMVAEASGCIYGDTLNVIYVECDPFLLMPNVFTPNGDGENDLFKPVFMENVKSSEMRIFNRWGQELFMTTEVRGGWNGETAGKKCVEGTYFWVLVVTGGINNDKTTTHHGNVTLVR